MPGLPCEAHVLPPPEILGIEGRAPARAGHTLPCILSEQWLLAGLSSVQHKCSWVMPSGLGTDVC